MKNVKANQDKAKRSAEDWVTIAKNFGDKCLDIQHDQKLSLDQKLEKQSKLSNSMVKEIENDSYLKQEEKDQMIKSINSYMEEWTMMHNVMQEKSKSNQNSASKK